MKPNVDVDVDKPQRGRGRPITWTADVDATIRRMSEAGYSDVEIGRHINRPTSSVFGRRRALGLPANLGVRRALCRLNLRRALLPT